MDVSTAIRERRTEKVMLPEDTPWPVPEAAAEEWLAELAALAGAAPFHFPCDAIHITAEQPSPAPWRLYLADAATCRSLLQRLPGCGQPMGKIGNMLAAADGLILVTWLPDPAPALSPAVATAASGLTAVSDQPGFAATQRNMEHIAAAAAACQNVLLAATADGRPNYWSSGGAVLRCPAACGLLGIPAGQILLGAIFLFPRSTAGAEVKPGGNRGRQGPPTSFSRWIR